MEYKIITDLAYTYIGLVTTMTKHYVENGVPLLFNSSIKSGNIDLSKPIYLDYEFANANKNRMHKKDDIITVHTGDIGTSAIIPEKLEGSLGFATIVTRIKDKNLLLPKYLCYFLNYGKGKEQLYKYARDARNNLNLTDYNRLIVPVPCIIEQRKIVEVIDSFHAIIDADKKQLELFDETVKSRFIEMFINKGFLKHPIRNVVDTKKISAKKTYQKNDEIKYIDISSIDNSSNQVIGYTSYAFKDAPSRAQQCLKTNDILVSTVRPNLKNIAIFKGDSGYVGSSGFCVLRALKCNPLYLKYIVLDDEFTSAMVKLTTGASYPAIRDDDVLDYEMIDAPIDLQDQFAEFVQLIDKSKFNVQQHINLMQELFDKKMEEFFGGE